MRYLTADTHPDHDTICAFRRNNLEAIASAFLDVLELSRNRGMGTVSLDGTHIRASASKDQNVTYERAQQLRMQLRQQVDELLQQAESADQQEENPQALPQQIARREKLLAKMEAACAQLEQRARERAAAERADCQCKVAAREQREGSAKGPAPKPPKATPEPEEQINLTDPDARLMRKSKRDGYTQSYNCQVVVDAGHGRLIVGQRVTDCASDAGQLEPDFQSIPATLGQPKRALADCGYVDTKVFRRLGDQRPGLDLYVSVHREDAHAERRHEYRPLDKINKPKAIKDPVLVAMADKLETPAGKAIYRRRACTVEPVFGVIKAVLGFRQFLLRGMKKVGGEWNLVCLAYNLKRLHRLSAGLKLAMAG